MPQSAANKATASNKTDDSQNTPKEHNESTDQAKELARKPDKPLPNPPQSLKSLANQEFVAWGQYTGGERHEDLIQYKKQMIGEK